MGVLYASRSVPYVSLSYCWASKAQRIFSVNKASEFLRSGSSHRLSVADLFKYVTHAYGILHVRIFQKNILLNIIKKLYYIIIMYY